MLSKNRLKMKALGLLLVACAAVLMGLGGLSLFDYGLPMALGKYDVAAQRLSVGSRGKALYNQALVAFDEHRWQDAAKSCDSAFASLCDDRGQVVDGLDNGLAAQTQFVLGASLVELNKHEQAIAAYDRCLALMPDQIDARMHEVREAARRTREWLRQSTKSSGKSAQPKQDNQQQAATRRRSGRI